MPQIEVLPSVFYFPGRGSPAIPTLGNYKVFLGLIAFPIDSDIKSGSIAYILYDLWSADSSIKSAVHLKHPESHVRPTL